MTYAIRMHESTTLYDHQHGARYAHLDIEVAGDIREVVGGRIHRQVVTIWRRVDVTHPPNVPEVITPLPAQVNWTAWGDTSPEATRAFIAALQYACDVAEAWSKGEEAPPVPEASVALGGQVT